MSSEHTVKSFEYELQRLNSLITQMGGMAEVQVANAVRATVRRDADLAARVIQGDHQLDDWETEVESVAVRMLALRQPMARDLREIVSTLRIAADIERMGDYAANIAKRSLAISQAPTVRPVAVLPRLGAIVQEQMKTVLDAYTDRDVEKALEAWRRDEELDDLYTSLFREVLTYMMEDPRTITPCTHLLFAAKNLERIGDHATNIAETIHFLVTGTRIAGDRPKGDESSFAVVKPEDEAGPQET